jgi:hypothetical protein
MTNGDNIRNAGSVTKRVLAGKHKSVTGMWWVTGKQKVAK